MSKVVSHMDILFPGKNEPLGHVCLGFRRHVNPPLLFEGLGLKDILEQKKRRGEKNINKREVQK